MSNKRYLEYSDSGVEWIGEIPKHWNIYKLKHVVNEFISGGTPKSSNDLYWDENNKGIPWVAIGDMTNNEYINETSKSLTREGLANKNLRILKKGTLIYSIFASLGKTSFLNIDATTNQAILGLITSDKIDVFYLKYYLEALKVLISSFSNENTQENLNISIVKNMEIAIPPSIKEQKQIANYLKKQIAKINATITKNEQILQLLEEKRISLIKQVVTKGLNSDAQMKDSGIDWIGTIPKHWEIKKLKLFVKLHNGKEINNEVEEDYEGAIGVYGSGGLFKYTDEHMYNGESVLFGRKGTLGKPIYLNDIFWTVDTMYYLSFNKELIPKYCYYYLTIYPWDKISTETAKPSVVGSDVTNSLFAIPDFNEQKLIVDYLDSKIHNIDEVISKIHENIVLLNEYKTSVIHHVVTGKIDVRGEEI